MQRIPRSIYALGLALVLLASSCTLERAVPPATAGPLDSLVRAQTGLSTGKIKITGPVTFQIGGAGNTATSTAIAKAKAPVATAPHAAATDASTKAGTPWQVLAGLAALGFVGGFVVRGKLKVPWPF